MTPGLCMHARKLMYCNLFLYETRTVRELYPDKLSTAGAVNQQKSSPAAFPTVFSTVEKAREWSILHIGPAGRRETETECRDKPRFMETTRQWLTPNIHMLAVLYTQTAA